MTTRPLSEARKEEFIHALKLQTKGCEFLGSPLNAHLLRTSLTDFEAGGATAAILADWQGPAIDGLVATRFIGGVHYLVITGQAAQLAPHYPSVGGRFDAPTFDQPLLETLNANIGFMREFIKSPPQTNEVRRSGVLLGGFLAIAHETGLPLRCFEVGASAGLNLLWNQFQYSYDVGTWGDADSPVSISCEWTGNTPKLNHDVEIVESAGCDISPIDLSDKEARTRLEAYVWPDHEGRVERLRAAMALALEKNISVDKADAADWVAEKLSSLPTGSATVVYHSIAAQYFNDDTTQRFHAEIKDAGQRATSDAPFAWLRFEIISAQELPYLQLTLWPGGESRTLGQGHPHGNFINWA